MGDKTPLFTATVLPYQLAAAQAAVAQLATNQVVTQGVPPVYRTQKARGLEVSWKLSMLAGNGYRVASPHGVYPTNWNTALMETMLNGKHELFARPCPVVPRHGFVESRMVKSWPELETVIAETIAADPNGEVILMRKLSGAYSAIMTASGVIWGRGHAGVTSGVGEQRIIPCPGGAFDNLLLNYLGETSLGNLGVYCELVEDNGHVCIVQLRTGPAQKSVVAKTHRPRFTKPITQFITPRADELDDLILWSGRLDAHKKEASHTAVWLPGQTLSSHFAVQAIAAGFNVSTDKRAPTIGEVLPADSNEPTEIDDAGYAQLAKAMDAERNFTFWDGPRDVLLSVAILHSIPLWGNDPWLLRLRARGVMIALRYGLAACLGESRHLLPATMDEASKEFGRTPKVPWKKLMGKNSSGVPERGFVFTRSFIMPWSSLRFLAKAASDDLYLQGSKRVKDWLADGGDLSSFKCSFRGHRWEWAAIQVHDLICAVNKFVRKPSSETWGAVLGFYNAIINAAHNGGYLLNKWVDATVIDRIAGTPAFTFGYPQVMSLVWETPGEKRAQTWLPSHMLPIEVAKDYILVAGITVHKKLAEVLYKLGIVDAAFNLRCKCNSCVVEARRAIGSAARTYEMPCYVGHAMMQEMPFIEAEQVIIPDQAMPKHMTVVGLDDVNDDDEEDDNG